MNERTKLDYPQGEWEISKFMNYPTFCALPPPIPTPVEQGGKGNKVQLKLGHYSLESQGKVILVAGEVTPILLHVFITMFN